MANEEIHYRETVSISLDGPTAARLSSFLDEYRINRSQLVSAAVRDLLGKPIEEILKKIAKRNTLLIQSR